MTLLNPRTEERSRHAFRRYLNPFMVTLWRLGLGPWVNSWPAVSGRIMVIANVGRKTGCKRLSPVNYAIVDGEIYCVAGFGAVSDWYRNVLANPNVEVWLPNSWWRGVAEDISDDPRRLDLMRQVLIASGFAGYVAGLNARKMSDAELDAATRSYPLLHIHRVLACTGPGGPGDWAWVWPLATLALLPLVLRKRKKSR